MKNNVIFIGMPGSGKTTVGHLVAQRLSYSFLNLDSMICKEYGGVSLQSLIDQLKFAGFLYLENKMALSLRCKKCVISTGGSMVLSFDGMRHLQSLGTVIFLDVPLSELSKRITNFDTRGIVLEKGQTLTDIYNQRMPLYRAYSDLTVSIPENQSPEETAAHIIKLLGKSS